MNRPIRLALVITELDVGGAEQCLVELATRLDGERFVPVVYSLAQRPAERDRLVQQLAAADIETVFLDMQPRAIEFSCGVRKLAALLRRQGAELVQTFLFHANVLGAQAARRAGVKRVVSGLRVAEPKWWRLCAEKWLARADKYVCVSQGVAAFYRQHGIADDRLIVIPNGVDVNRFAKATPADLTAFGLPPAQRALVYVGRLHKQKGLRELLAAMPAILRELPGHDLLLVGDGEERPVLERLARTLSIEGRVHFAGWRANVPAILAAAEVLLLPSRFEGMPNAVLEAMASGKPCVATRVEGVEELLGGAGDQQLAPLGDMTQFRQRVVAIASNAQLASELGQSNRQRAATFSWDRMVAQYERLYFSLLAD